MLIDLPGIQIHAEMQNSEIPGTPVCLLHCFGSNLHFWDAQMPWLTDRPVLRFDARGHGLSSRPDGPYSLAQMAQDALALLDHIGLERVHLCGASIGGMVAQYLAIEYPQRLASVSLVTTTFEYSARQVAGWVQLSRQVQAGGIAAVHDALMARWFSPASAVNGSPGYQFMDEVFARFHPDSFVAAAEAVRGVDFRGELSRIEMPTLIIASENDPGVPAELSLEMAEAIDGSEFSWTPFAHHLASLEHPEMVGETLRDFLARLDSRSAQVLPGE